MFLRNFIMNTDIVITGIAAIFVGLLQVFFPGWFRSYVPVPTRLTVNIGLGLIVGGLVGVVFGLRAKEKEPK
jgi:hypothetical protein